MSFTKTELHTHLMGMLSADNFLKLLSRYIEFIPWPLNEPLTDETNYLSIEDAVNFKSIKKQIMIPEGKKVDYSELDNLYKSRSELLKYAVKVYSEKIRLSSQDENKDISEDELEKSVEIVIYNDYLNNSLLELINQDVEYVEISFSNAKLIKCFQITPEIKKKIKFKILLSTDRSRTRKQMKQSAKDLNKLLANGMAVGFDIMGQETPLSDAEKNYQSKVSFKKKLEILFNELLKYKNTTLRIHSGETPNSLGNTIQILEYIDEIQNEKGIVIPPPEIRIGHGIYFEKAPQYIYLLKKFKCIIEINASSNCRLGNIENINQIPYKYYIDNGIPIVISTDGHGLYDTTIKKEDNIAKKVLNYSSQNGCGDYEYEQIIENDRKVLERKVK